MLVAFDTSHLDTSNTVRPVQEVNVPCMSLIPPVFHLDTSSLVRPVHPPNMLLMVRTLPMRQSATSSVVSFAQFWNVADA